MTGGNTCDVTPAMSALERAEEDIERGDYGLARQRLTSYLSNSGYHPDVLTRLGQISHEMHDLFQAGRFWLTSDAEGEQVEQSVSLFVERAGADPSKIVAQLPRPVRLARIDAYPEMVRDRLDRLGLSEAIVVAAANASKPPRNAWAHRTFVVGCLVVFSILVLIFLVGVAQIICWVLVD